MEYNRFTSLLITEKRFKNAYKRLKTKHFIKIISKKNSIKELNEIDKSLRDIGYVICGEDENGDFMYVNFERASVRNKEIIAKAHYHYLEELGLMKL